MGALGLVVRPLQPRAYGEAVEAMQRFTFSRDAGTPDEIWLVEHDPVFTLGHAARPEHLLAPGAIPVERTQRGGQVTYHGPGQVLAYTLVDLHRRRLKVHRFVHLLEQAVIDVLARFRVEAGRREAAPGVYVSRAGAGFGAKIASIGIRISQGRTWHGLALNVAMDLGPFSRINPCGYPGLAVTDLRSELRAAAAPAQAGAPVAACEASAPQAADPGSVAEMLGTTLAHLLEGSQ